MKHPFFTIVMPVYKVEKYIERCILSVLGQTYTNFELLIVDDGSPDKSREIAKGYAKKDDRVTILSKPNGGLSDARNYGIDRAKGDYLYFIDSDDWIENNLLETIVHKITVSPADIYVFGYFLDTETDNGKLLQQQKIAYKNAHFLRTLTSPPELSAELLNLLGYAWNKVYSKKIIDTYNLRFDKGISLVEDMLFNSRAYCKASAVIIIKEHLYHYINRNVETLIKTYHKDSFDLILKKHKAIEAFLNNWNYTEAAVNKALAHNLVLGIQYCINNLLLYENNLTASEKKMYIDQMFQNTETKKYINWYVPVSKIDFIYKKIIKYRLVTLTMYLKTWKKTA
ncbi:glycosyltransferase family 2 protein [Galbibacter pacificus]|uniref:Glycosyltransferase family 2 protein n=1 Tax=Galbibacter pacificus TaxID=2996052 RepID=A0ABT6FRC1_9FLAO|nr:glycosyltransferase family 2 protein [Galbibacter pacificus]MDG3581735.1 glycosyltransferase family 2 protein [Galbibacter pacificus]MDG3585791.1 glycosyltransferase family 2 protein [Galbibacter pacificus]